MADNCLYCGLPDEDDEHYTNADCVRALKAELATQGSKLEKMQKEATPREHDREQIKMLTSRLADAEAKLNQRWQFIDYLADEGQEHLPPSDAGRVLIAVTRFDDGGRYVSEAWRSANRNGEQRWFLPDTDRDGDPLELLDAEVTHWMPLPEPPHG